MKINFDKLPTIHCILVTAVMFLVGNGVAFANPLPNAISYEYFGLNYAMNVATSNSVGTLDYTGRPGCGGLCNATTQLGNDPSVSLNANEIAFNYGGGGYAQAQLTYYVQYNNAPGTYSVNLMAKDTLTAIHKGDAASAQAYLAFGQSVANPDPNQPYFQSYAVNETDCSNRCDNGVANYQSPASFPAVTPVQMIANTPYLVQMFVVISPATEGVPFNASVDPTFSTSATGGNFTFSSGVTAAVAEPKSSMLLLAGLGIISFVARRKPHNPS